MNAPNHMQCVCVSYNAPPMNDAESLCTIRLLSALTNHGVDVHLVTSECPPTLAPDIAAEIMDPAIRVTRVPQRHPTLPARLTALLRWGLHAPENTWIREAVRTTRRILHAYASPPLLITRAMPIVSNVVGYYCRDLAAAWFPHLSDPYPPFEWKEHWYSSAGRPINFLWARRFLAASGFATVTCPNAARYTEEKLGGRAPGPIHVLTHLAQPPLRPGGFRLPREPGTFVFAHLGNLMARRRPDILIEGILRAAKQCPGIRFLQYGHIDESVLRMFSPERLGNVVSLHSIDNLSPRDSSDLQKQTDVNVVVDTDLGLPYSPFILSKYPHCACSGQPLLMITENDSAMGDCTRRHGGGICVGYNADAVANACVRLWQARETPSTFAPPEALMAEFSPARVVSPFLDRIRREGGYPNG